MVTIAPSITNILSRAGIATISFDLSATLTCPRTSREGRNHMDSFFPALLLIGAAHCLAVNGDHAFRHPGQRRHPGDEAALELLRIEGCKNVAKVIMAGCPVQKWPEPTQKGDLLLAEPCDIYDR